MSRPVRIALLSLLGTVMLLSTFIGGFVLSNVMDTTVQLSRQRDTSSLDGAVLRTFDILKLRGLEPPSEETATAGAILGMLRSGGDRWANYIPPSDYQDWAEDMSGKFGGIGVVLAEKDGTSYVVEVYADTPAERAGIQSGDYFYGIDSETSESWSVQQIQKLVKGNPGTEVELTMLRPWPQGEMPEDPSMLGKPYTVTLTRGVIEVPIVTTDQFGSVSYIRMTQFNALSEKDVTEAIDDAESSGATSIILDLRNNPGGLLEQAVAVSSLFIGEGAIVSIEERDKEPEVLYATGILRTDLPLVVLVNENSASASEIVAGAIQDYGRGVLIGAPTFGKGSVQSQIELGNGGIISFTTAHYFTGKGRAIDGIGLEPDVTVEMDHLDIREFNTDTQLKVAIAEAKKLAEGR